LKTASFVCRLDKWPLALISLSACLLSPYPSPVPVGNDTSIRFPEFSDQRPIAVGETDSPYQLDGVTLRALMIAANDYIPLSTQGQDCLDRQDAQLYRVIRQGDIIFVSVSFNFSSSCQPKAFPLDGGARYAISTDGRILRRLVGIEPDGFPREERPGKSIPVPDSKVGGTQIPFDGPSPYLPRSWQDAGPHSVPSTPSSGTHDGGSLPLDGGTPITDGGLPGGSQNGGL
jgi:hypothetical protein